MKIDFEDIYDRFFRDVYLFALAMSGNPAIAEDVTQETFFRALKGIKNFNGGCSVKSWLCQIAKNLYIDDVRRKKRDQSAREELSDNLLKAQDVEGSLIRREEVISICRALHCLEEPYKEVFSLRILGELSYKEIADIFEKSESWARVTYHRAKLRLRSVIL